MPNTWRARIRCAKVCGGKSCACMRVQRRPRRGGEDVPRAQDSAQARADVEPSAETEAAFIKWKAYETPAPDAVRAGAASGVGRSCASAHPAEQLRD